MMRALWTAASGMSSQQLNVDTISNNLSNVNTTGFKKETMEFQSLLYETMKRADLDPANDLNRPVNLQVGHGVKPVSTARSFSQGNMQATDSVLDFAIEGPGFFMVQRAEDDIVYTRDGSFKISATEDGGEMMLVTSAGYPVLDMEEEPIMFDEDMLISSLAIDREGNLTYKDEEGEIQQLDFQIGVVQFSNVQGLEAAAGNVFQATTASGEAIVEEDGDVIERSVLRQKYLEMSNVSVATEMVDLIVAQRAYELNSKCIQTADEMLQNANNLKR